MTDASNQHSRTPLVVTRMEIIEAVGTVFGRSGATTREIISSVTQENCREEVVAALQRLPERTFSHVRDLWDYLPDIPIGD